MKYTAYFWINYRSIIISQQLEKKLPILSSIYYNIIFNYQNQTKFCFYLFIFFYLFSNIENKYYRIYAKWLDNFKIYLFQFIIKLKNFGYFLTFLYFSSVANNLNSYISLYSPKLDKNLSIMQLSIEYINNFILLNCIFAKNILIYKQVQLFQFTLLIKALALKNYYKLELLFRWLLKFSVLFYLVK